MIRNLLSCAAVAALLLSLPAMAEKPSRGSGKAKEKSGAGGKASDEKKPAAGKNPGKAAPALLTEAQIKAKSEAAGAVMKQFMDARSLEAQLPLVRNPHAVRSSMEMIHKVLGDGNFALQHGRIMGAAFGGTDGKTLYFPYLLATGDAPSGFLVPVVEAKQGFLVDWAAFAEGWQRPLQQWIAEPDKAEASFYAVVLRTHAFDTRAAAEGEGTIVLEVREPQLQVNGDPVILVAGGRSRSVKAAEELTDWNSGRLVRVTLARRDDGWFDLRRIQAAPLPEIPAKP